jgi:hypothetical protein
LRNSLAWYRWVTKLLLHYEVTENSLWNHANLYHIIIFHDFISFLLLLSILLILLRRFLFFAKKNHLQKYMKNLHIKRRNWLFIFLIKHTFSWHARSLTHTHTRTIRKFIMCVSLMMSRRRNSYHTGITFGCCWCCVWGVKWKKFCFFLLLYSHFFRLYECMCTCIHIHIYIYPFRVYKLSLHTANNYKRACERATWMWMNKRKKLLCF